MKFPSITRDILGAFAGFPGAVVKKLFIAPDSGAGKWLLGLLASTCVGGTLGYVITSPGQESKEAYQAARWREVNNLD